MAGGNQGSTGGQGLGGFGGGFGQSFGLGGGQPSYGGFGQGQGLYSPSTGVGGSGYIQGTAAPSYGTYGASAGDVAADYTRGNPWYQNAAMQRYGVTPTQVYGTQPINSATGKAYTPNEIYNNAVTGYYAPDIQVKPTSTDADKAAIANNLNTPYYGTFGTFSAKDLQNFVNNPNTNSPQGIQDAMQQYGVSAHDLATSGALSPQDYTRTFRPSYQTQSSLNPNQYYQPIYQTQYQNYASPAYANMANANGMGLYNQRAQQQYANPMSYLGGSFNPYTNSNYNQYAGGFGGQGYGIDSILGQLGGYLDQYMSKYNLPTQSATTTAAPTQTTAAPTTTTAAPTTTATPVQTAAPTTTATKTAAPTTTATPVQTAAPTTTATKTAAPTTAAPTTAAPTTTTAAPTTTTAAPTTYGNQKFTAQQVTDWVNDQMKNDPANAAKTIADAAKQYGISNEQLAGLTYAGDKTYSADQIGNYLGSAKAAKTGGIMSLTRR